MATTNKSLTTYLTADSLEWLKRYCLGVPHLLNNDGNPKLGTALADIISRLATGELTIPTKSDPASAVPNNVLYGTEIEALKGEVEDLKKLFTEYRTSSAPSTVPDDSLRGEVEALERSVTELKTYCSDRFAAVNELISPAVARFEFPDLKSENSSSSRKANQVDLKSHLVNTESIAVPAATSQEKPNADGDIKTFTQLAKQLNYKIPDGVKAASPRTEGAEGLISFAATLGHSYKWDGRNRKFSKTEVVD